MPALKIRSIFICHSWSYSDHYRRIVDWFHEEPYFKWRNCSVPEHNPLPGKDLNDELIRQVRPAQIVIVIAAMYAAYSSWIKFEISEAVRMAKPIVAIEPRGQEKIPALIVDAVDETFGSFVGWTRAGLVGAVRDLV